MILATRIILYLFTYSLSVEDSMSAEGCYLYLGEETVLWLSRVFCTLWGYRQAVTGTFIEFRSSNIPG